MSKIVEKILEILQDQAENTVDLMDIMLSDRSPSYKKARHSIRYGPRQFKSDWAYVYRERQKFYSTLNELKRSGLVLKAKKDNKTSWEITQKGLNKLLKPKQLGGTPLKSYKSAKEVGLVIISYDIPERERNKRSWLRESLKNLEFSLLQKSLWVGHGGVPEEFIHDLRHNNLHRYVHIFSVSSSGTIEKTL